MVWDGSVLWVEHKPSLAQGSGKVEPNSGHRQEGLETRTVFRTHPESHGTLPVHTFAFKDAGRPVPKMET